jgi:hypothetical protein
MKSRFLLLLLTISSVLYAGRPWKMESVDPQEKVTLTIDLYEESVEVPGMEMFGLMNGYLGGNIYGVWPVTSFRIKGNRAILRLSNDLGSETQEAELVQTSDSTYMLELKGSVVVKRAVGRKLVKIAPTLKMFRRAR